jgi:hypothetical protein
MTDKEKAGCLFAAFLIVAGFTVLNVVAATFAFWFGLIG